MGQWLPISSLGVVPRDPHVSLLAVLLIRSLIISSKVTFPIINISFK